MARLSEIDVLVVDCQTTGATPVLGSVLEIGWGIAKAGATDVDQLQAHWITIPGGFVPFQVRRLTGFEESHAATAIDASAAWERLRASMGFAARVPAAIHFARFELAFLRDWSERFEPQTGFPLDTVCLHAIACRLYPDLPRRSIRALAGFLGHGVDLERRCLGHVEATAFIWRKLVSELASRGVDTWDQLGDFLETPERPKARKRRYPFPAARYRALPDEPGVYRFVRSNGDVLYVGKAASLRKRVAGHFTAGSSTTERALEMLTQVHDVEVTPARTALEAALLENECIKSLRPPYNLQLVAADPRIWFTTKRLDAASSQPDDAHRCGPLPSTFAVRAFGAIRALLEGEPATVALRARAVEAPERWAPDDAVFAAGFASFTASHALTLGGSRERGHRELVAAARRLLVAPKVEPAAKGATDLDDESNVGASGPRSWDPDRVVRHLERAVAHGYQLLQRARWLCLLFDSVVVVRELPSQGARMLLVRGGQVVEACDVAPDTTFPEPPVPRSRRERQATFDRSVYDRLRTLTTELKRVIGDRGTAEVRVGRRWLRGSALEALLRWV